MTLRGGATVARRIAFRSLIATAPLANGSSVRRVWEGAWSRLVKGAEGSVTVRLHGRSVTMPLGYPYPAFLRRWPSYNAPLVAAVRESAMAAQSRVRVVDVGAAVGDTALLLAERCGQSLDEIVCIEGDQGLFAHLSRNLRGLPHTRLILSLLSDAQESIPALMPTHPGTRSALGSGWSTARTLDDLVSTQHLGVIDVIKTDVDGFDGRVLAGATGVLRRDRPTVVFEWHPRLYIATGNDWHVPFETLRTHGYTRFGWFTKTGRFSHTDDGAADGAEVLARVCLEDAGPLPDWHYDLVAIHSASPVDMDRIAAAAAVARL